MSQRDIRIVYPRGWRTYEVGNTPEHSAHSVRTLADDVNALRSQQHTSKRVVLISNGTWAPYELGQQADYDRFKESVNQVSTFRFNPDN
jgi:hypothetical protein